MSLDNLKSLLSSKQGYVRDRYTYYNAKHNMIDFGISTPPKLMAIQSILGWASMAVEANTDRLLFREVKKSNDGLQMNQLLNDMNSDVNIDKLILDSGISSCSFAYVYPEKNTIIGEDGNPEEIVTVKLQPIDGYNATGYIDETTNMVTEGYAILERDEQGNPILEAYFVPGKVTYYYKDGKTETFEFSTKYSMLIPFVWKPSTTKSFGKSIITKSMISLLHGAQRTVKGSEIAREYYSYPQKYVLGLQNVEEEDEEDMPQTETETAKKWRLSMSTLLEIFNNEDGTKPTVGQFTTSSMEPFMKQLEMFASLFGAEAGLTLEDMGFPSSVPSSEQAIKASHAKLNASIKKAKRYYGASIKNLLCVACSLRDEVEYDRSYFSDLKLVWEPTFDLDYSSLSSLGDAIIKINQACPDFVKEDTLSELTGIEG